MTTTLPAADVDTFLAKALRYDLPRISSEVEVPWFWAEPHEPDPIDVLLVGTVTDLGEVSNMRLRHDDGREEKVPSSFEAMARADLRDAAEELWRTP